MTTAHIPLAKESSLSGIFPRAPVMHLGLILALLCLSATTPAEAGLLDDLAVAETHRLEAGSFYRDFGGARDPGDWSSGAFAVELDRDLVDSFEYGDRADEFGPVVTAVRVRLDQGQGVRSLDASLLPAAGAPRVYVGSAVGELAPPAAEETASPADDFPPMVLHLERPSKAWQQAVASLMVSQDVDYLILVRIGVSQYPKGRRGVFAKNVLLGTGHEQPLKFLTAEDRLLEVLQVTGMLVDGRGRVVRAGAEGILAHDTPMLAQSFEIDRLLDDGALRAAISTERRRDLPGAPLSLEVAVDNLVGQLLKDPRRVLRPL